MDPDFDEWDELYVVSDLHLGGETGFQMCRTGALLGRTIRHLAERAMSRSVALVLNGDVVDFLAEPGAVVFDPFGAADRLSRIANDPAFTPVFLALRDFLSVPQATLVVVLGNHDLELALPRVQRRLLQMIDPKGAARGRVRFAVDGAGYRAQVGGKSVYCFHGEVSDAFNVVDHQGLREQLHHILRGTPPPPWRPNAGTSIVIDIMNEAKAKYPFIDLVKPEMTLAIPLALDVDPSLKFDAARWSRAINILLGVLKPAPNRSRYLGDGGRSAGAARPLAPGLPRADAAFLDAHAGADPLDMLDSEGTLGVDAVVERLRSFALGFTPSRTALRALVRATNREDRTFQTDQPDDPMRWAVAQGIPCDYIVAGHTHLRRQVVGAHQTYFNCGTWASVMKVPTADLQDPAAYDTLVDRIRASAREHRDGTRVEDDGRMDVPSIVSIIADGDGVQASLCTVTADGGTAVKLTPLSPGAPQ